MARRPGQAGAGGGVRAVRAGLGTSRYKCARVLQVFILAAWHSALRTGGADGGGAAGSAPFGTSDSYIDI